MTSSPHRIVVAHGGTDVALCTSERISIAAAIEALPEDHPERVLVEVKCLVAGAILRGHVPGPYDDAEADAAARSLVASLVPDA